MGLRPNLRLRKNKRRLQKLTIILMQGGKAFPLASAQGLRHTPFCGLNRRPQRPLQPRVAPQMPRGANRQSKKSDSFHGRKACLSAYIFAHRPFDKLREHLRQAQGTAVTLNLFQGLFRNKTHVFKTSHIRHLFSFVVSSATPRVFSREWKCFRS